jgi:hypothetical protein
VLDQRGRLLRAALVFAGLPRPSYPLGAPYLARLVVRIGHVAVGMHRQGLDRQLTQYDGRGSRATFYTTGTEHSPTSATGTGWEPTPWRATQRGRRRIVRSNGRSAEAATDCQPARTHYTAAYRSSMPTRLTVRLADELARTLMNVARRTRRSRSEIVRLALQEFLGWTQPLQPTESARLTQGRERPSLKSSKSPGNDLSAIFRLPLSYGHKLACGVRLRADIDQCIRRSSKPADDLIRSSVPGMYFFSSSWKWETRAIT